MRQPFGVAEMINGVVNAELDESASEAHSYHRTRKPATFKKRDTRHGGLSWRHGANHITMDAIIHA